jgi:hypothetical protein
VSGYASATNNYTYGVVGVSDSPQDGSSGLWGFTTATSGMTYGLWGKSVSTAGTGVYGWASATSGTTYGVYGATYSGSGYGVYGKASASNSAYSKGVAGESFATSGTTYGVFGSTSSASGYGVYGAASASDGNYGLYSYGNFAATGSKAAIVQTQDYGWLHLYSMESPDVLFEDVGSARLVQGTAVVTIDPVFAQTVNLKEPYQVFLTPRGDCGLYVSDAGTTSFTVSALGGKACNIAFDYRIIATRLGYEKVRLAAAEDPSKAMQADSWEGQPTENQP